MKQTQIKILPFSSGWHWIVKAGNMIGKHLEGFFNLAIIWMLIGWLDVVPLVGTLLLALITPGLIAGTMTAFHSSYSDKAPRGIQLLSILLSERRAEILQLGLIVILLSILGVLLIGFVVTATIPEWRSIMEVFTSQDPDSITTLTNLLINSNLMPTLLAAIIVFAAISASLFFAIPRLIFDAQALTSVLKESLITTIRNWRALFMFGLAQVFVMLAGAIMLSIFLIPLSLLPATLQTLMVGLIFGLFFALFQVLVTGGQYLAWREIFATQEPIDDVELDPPDQLVA